MGALVEICQSHYSHFPLTEFGKKYYISRYNNAVLCQECIDAWIDKSAVIIQNEIWQYIEVLDIPTTPGDEVSITKKLHCPDYMEFILPCTVKISPFKQYTTFDTETPLTRTFAVTFLGQDTCYGEFTFTFKLELPINPVWEDVYTRIKYFIEKMVAIQFLLLPDDLVQLRMDAKVENPTKYGSACSCSTCCNGASCEKCKVSTATEYYIYNNTRYCVNCMYEIIVDIAVSSGLTDALELSADYTGQTKTNILIRDSLAWKRAVIDKFIIAYKSAGVDPHIIHYQVIA